MPSTPYPVKTPLFRTESLWVVEFQASGEWLRSGDFVNGIRVYPLPPTDKVAAEVIAGRRSAFYPLMVYRVRELGMGETT